MNADQAVLLLPPETAEAAKLLGDCLKSVKAALAPCAPQPPTRPAQAT